MIMPEWPRNISSAVTKHFDGLRGSTYMYLPGHPDDKRGDNEEWFELRVIGPEIEERNKGTYFVSFEVDCLIQVNTEKNVLAFAILAGEISSWFTCINVYDDSGVLLGTPNLSEGVVVTPYAIAKEHPHQTGTVIGAYDFFIDN